MDYYLGYDLSDVGLFLYLFLDNKKTVCLRVVKTDSYCLYCLSVFLRHLAGGTSNRNHYLSFVSISFNVLLLLHLLRMHDTFYHFTRLFQSINSALCLFKSRVQFSRFLRLLPHKSYYLIRVNISVYPQLFELLIGVIKS